MASKDELKRLIDQLPDRRTDEVFGVLISLLREGDALAQIPVDDEPETSEEAEAVALSREARAQGNVFSSAEAKRRLLG